MKTIVYQSYRTQAVPPWISECLNSVKDWAQAGELDYHFLGDEFLQRPPPWYLEKVRHNVLLTTDLARLLVARDFLTQGYERAIWVDADVLVFDPERLTIDVESEYAFCGEIWVEKRSLRERVFQLIRGRRAERLKCEKRVNNSVCVFVAGNSLLDFYIHAAQQIVALRNPASLTPWTIGVGFLTRLHSAIHLPILTSVGQISPLMLEAICENQPAILSEYAKRLKKPIQAANLCSSFSGQSYQSVQLSASKYLSAVHALSQSKGKQINDLIPGQPGNRG